MTVAITSTDECNASEIKARLPIAIPTANLAAAMPALAKTEIAATRDLTLWASSFMGCGLAAGVATLKRRSAAQRHAVGDIGLLRIVPIKDGIGIAEGR